MAQWKTSNMSRRAELWQRAYERLHRVYHNAPKMNQTPAVDLAPQALRRWHYPGDNFGQEVAYTKARAMQLAEASNEIVPAEIAEPTPDNLASVPFVTVHRSGRKIYSPKTLR
jgi:hypothetical protein